MTIEEMGNWLNQVDGGEEAGAVLAGFRLCLEDPDAVEHIAKFASALEPSDEVMFVLALGFFLAVQSIDVLQKNGVPWQLDPPAPAKVQ
jgi:hypothetical protein